MGSTLHSLLPLIQDGWIYAEHNNLPSTVDELEAFVGPALMLAHTLEQASSRLKAWKAG